MSAAPGPATVAVLALALGACTPPGDPSAPAARVENHAAASAPDVASAPSAPVEAHAQGDGAAGAADAARWDGVGPATFGMSADAVRAAWGDDLGGSIEEEPACYHLSPTTQPDFAYFAMMFGDGAFVRYSVSNDAMRAPGGGRRGMSDADIEALYPGRIQRQPHKYVDGEYLRIEGEDGRVLLFETDADGTVTEWRVGVPPYVDYVEGCA